MFLRSHARASGLDDRGQPYQAAHAAAFEDGQIVAVGAHTWLGMFLVQARFTSMAWCGWPSHIRADGWWGSMASTDAEWRLVCQMGGLG